MDDNEFLLFDRITKIQSIINQYGEDQFYISFSGGKDSVVLSKLIDLALPDNKIPRVYADTGIELNMVRDFVYELQKTDNRIIIIKPKLPIKPMLDQDGYPFKSKAHAHMHERYKRIGLCDSVLQYLGEHSEKPAYKSSYGCPKSLRYQFTEQFDSFKISDKCCLNLKERPLDEYSKQNNKPYGINGIMRDEGGRRSSGVCLLFRANKLKHFQPLIVLTKQWEDWFIEKYNIRLCDLYYEPYNFKRTGCKGCPFSINLQHELDVLEEFFPAEHKQCEYIWKPVYDEYRRLGYRLKQVEPDVKTKKFFEIIGIEVNNYE